MRLIDADALMEEIAKHSYIVRQKDNSRDLGMTVYGIQQCVDEQPTAYDLDSKVAELEKCLSDSLLGTGDYEDYDDYYQGESNAYKHAIEVVQRGVE